MMQVPHIAAPLGASVNHRAVQSGVDVPSKQSLELHDVLLDQVGNEAWVRFRFVAPEIGKGDGDMSFSDVEADFQVLCDAFVRPYLSDFDLAADVVAISLMSEPVAFGVSDPAVTQFVEVFRLASGACVWEGL